jgi:hypothetical protein
LTARLPNLELVCHAPVGDITLPPGSPALYPLDRKLREHFARNFDAVLIGGGDLLRFEVGARRLRSRNELLEERLRDIEGSAAWRLLGSYERFRSRANPEASPDDGARGKGDPR